MTDHPGHQSNIYQCPICHQKIDDDIRGYIEHGEKHIVDEIKKDHPDWGLKDGACPKCLNYYRHQIEGNEGDR